MSVATSIRCLCGQAGADLHGQPAARAYCHCLPCRELYGGALLSATAWPAEAVHPTGGATRIFVHPFRQMSKTFCAVCGDTLFGTNRLGMRVVPNGIVARSAPGGLPPGWAPVMHLFYRQRVFDVADGLTKYLDGWDGPEYAAA